MEEPSEPQPISPAFRTGAALLVVGALVIMLVAMLKPKISLFDLGGPGEVLEASFTVPGEFAPRSLSSFRGRAVVVALWTAARCDECPGQLLALNELATRYGPDGLVALALTESAPSEIVAYPGIGGLQILTGSLAKAQADTLEKTRPYVYVLDRQGRLRHKSGGLKQASDLSGAVEKALALN
ncbi:MAG: redoxin domain-containing protein [Acidobacteria bacterium]|nr:redoxin domain-containing protein [Acidobacteriota bacterium]